MVLRCLNQALGRLIMSRKTALSIALFFLLLPLSSPLAGCEKLDELREGETATQLTVRTTVPPEMQADANSTSPSISADGRYIAFRSDATNLVIGNTNGAAGIYVKDRRTGSTIRVSVNDEGAQSDEDALSPAMAADGRSIAFESTASNLVAGAAPGRCTSASGARTNCQDIYFRDLDAARTSLVSSAPGGIKGDQNSGSPSISADGRFVAFLSAASDLLAGDTNSLTDIFIEDTRLGDVSLVSSGAGGEQADGESSRPAVSADGRLVAFSSLANNLVPEDTNGKRDVFVKDMQSGTVRLVSSAPDGSSARGNSGYSVVQISGDGRFVAFESEAADLVPDDTNGKRDIFIRDLATGDITRVSVSAAGNEGLEDSYKSASISTDGQWIAFQSDAPNLVAGDTNGKSDIFVRNMQTGAVGLVSANSGGNAGNGESDLCSISADGLWVAFDSAASNLAGEDTNNKKDIFLKDTQTGAITRVSTSTADVL